MISWKTCSFEVRQKAHYQIGAGTWHSDAEQKTHCQNVLQLFLLSVFDYTVMELNGSPLLLSVLVAFFFFLLWHVLSDLCSEYAISSLFIHKLLLFMFDFSKPLGWWLKPWLCHITAQQLPSQCCKMLHTSDAHWAMNQSSHSVSSSSSPSTLDH